MEQTTALQKTTPVPTPEEVNEKRQAWANFGENLAVTEQALSFKAQAALALLTPITDIAQIPQAEANLKAAKAEFRAIEEERKKTTGKLDAVIQRLMGPEKSGAEPLAQYSANIINFKRIEQEKQQKEKDRRDQLAKAKELMITTRNNADASFKQLTIAKVEKVYAYALGKGNIAPLLVQEFLKNIAIPALKDTDLVISYPANPYPLITVDEFTALCAEHLIIDKKPYFASYENQLRVKFSDYEIAYSQKEIALANSEKEAKANQERIAAENANANVAAKLESMAAETGIISTSKPLKSSYAVDLEETVENMIVIMAAFTAHIDKCMPHLRVNKWFSFTPSQAAIALGKVKTEDNEFNPSGIIFKTVDKL